MKHAIVLSLMLATVPVAANADAKAPSPVAPPCVDVNRGYNIRAIGHRDLWIREELGKPDRPQLRLSTTCFNLEPTTAFTIQAFTSCVDRGDFVVAQDLGGRMQRCRILSVSVYDGKPAPGYK